MTEDKNQMEVSNNKYTNYATDKAVSSFFKLVDFIVPGYIQQNEPLNGIKESLDGKIEDFEEEEFEGDLTNAGKMAAHYFVENFFEGMKKEEENEIEKEEEKQEEQETSEESLLTQIMSEIKPETLERILKQKRKEENKGRGVGEN